MNRYPVWKYVVIVIALLFGVLYTIPNYYGESPALQISSNKATVKVGPEMIEQVKKILTEGKFPHDDVTFGNSGTSGSVRVRFPSTTVQFNAKAALEKDLNTDKDDPTYSVSFNLLSNTPAALQKIRALPMFLGLDLRGGVHFLMQVDTKVAVEKRIVSVQMGARAALKEKDIHGVQISRDGQTIIAKFKDVEARKKGKEVIFNQIEDLVAVEGVDGDRFTLSLTLKPMALQLAKDNAVKQNISTLNKRVNELGVSEPLIQQQGGDRIVVQLPGVQDVAKAKDIIGRTATLEVRMVDESVLRGQELEVPTPFGSELFKVGREVPVVLYKDPVLTGDYISSASSGADQGQPTVNIDLNSAGGNKMRQATREKVGKLMSIVLFEKGKGEVLTVATIQSELGSKFQITGMGSPEKAADLALLLRAGSLAAPMDFIEERTIGPQLGAENIKKGFNSTLYGFAAISIFMIGYYMMFGIFSVSALALNVLLLVAVLSGIQAALTLPGMAAIALALGMAIDSNVLINERIREELRAGNTPQGAIREGFDRAWDTILDSNVTTLIVGIALFVFGSGAIRGFAMVHMLGILTSMFSAVFFSRGLVNLWYGSRKKLTTLSIGEVWKPKK